MYRNACQIGVHPTLSQRNRGQLDLSMLTRDWEKMPRTSGAHVYEGVSGFTVDGRDSSLTHCVCGYDLALGVSRMLSYLLCPWGSVL